MLDPYKLSMSSVLAAVLLGVTAVRATPALSSRQSITALTTTQIDVFTPYTWYASTAYCEPSQTLAWDCGSNCEANPDFQPVASGGDGDSIQYWYVGYDPSFDTVIVAHQGTNPEEMESLVTDADFFLENLDSSLFPGISSDIECHSGFADEQADTATDILAAVEQTMSQYDTTSVTMVGHSLGAAISLLDSVYLPLWLPEGTTFRTVVYGLPRVGNQAFANYVDATCDLTHINNEEDPIPICPGMFLGYIHPAGEVHIEDSGEWASCPGQDNPSTQCIVGDVPEIWDGDLDDHDGPYNGVTMGC
ncbi:Alpha/Beta hydrolase protein [Chiua virens]|nr:Alpha/Beta hydrolase protein [Chiua virens]